MATYLESFDASQDAQFQQRVRIALLIKARDILTDANPPANQADLLSLVGPVVTEEKPYVRIFAEVLCALGTTKTATDAALLTSVGTVWSALAGRI